MTQVNHLIEIQGLKKTYQSGDTKVTAIKQMEFFIDDEEFIAIMGQSGSGKSTLLSIMGALNQPTQGKVLVDSLDLYSLTGEQRADFRSEYIGFIFQSFQLIPYLTVLENVKLPMAVTGQKKKVKNDMALEVIKRVGLETKAYRLPDQLSGGEQERVAIARAIVNKPPIILADEPTGNLDTKTANEIMMLLQSLNEEGHTIIVVTHNSDMGAYATRSIKVQDGECFA
ncbi:MAG: ABC transporter ATP-binding protein [Desulfobacula sp.]|jgi:putative ABC transport system ATP-binding protein|uniref:ABC transporter ATP-binding protein n=2 Tax=Desulfobacula sp. TaxID=2593537 RepID=UPI001DE30E60|nr:ABC transporter ATP-binding protein [Desulfobacula sp.]MBT3803274.1 ABC transporter ATP-binding protein [Desulfobacula sp.]MBT5969920.1 ABC transporter ATP-binding protein [Desulfobacula sp.]MBT7048654.1 ABC transporter ATP-binding protein [Desulfobacula sp.]